MDSFLDKNVGLFPLAKKKNKTKEPQMDDTLEDSSGDVAFCGFLTLMCSELAKKTISAAIPSGLRKNWKTIQETIATPVTGVWSPPKRRNHCSVLSNSSLLKTPSVSASLSFPFSSSCLSLCLCSLGVAFKLSSGATCSAQAPSQSPL